MTTSTAPSWASDTDNRFPGITRHTLTPTASTPIDIHLERFTVTGAPPSAPTLILGRHEVRIDQVGELIIALVELLDCVDA